MKSHLTLVFTSAMDREAWLAYRQDGIGASESGAVLGLDDYTSSLELFYHKIGDIPRPDFEGIYQFFGNIHEDRICDLWQYWGGTEESMIANYRAENVVRKCRRLRAFVRNPKYPWLYCSLDRVINKHDGREEGTLEAKSIGTFEMDKWEAGLPPKFVVQVNQQMLVPEFEYGEMALMQDGRRFHVLPFERSATIQESIVERTHEFWQRVLKARPLVNEKYLAMQRMDQRGIDQCNAAIEALAPPPDGTEAYANYLSERYQRAAGGERRGSAIELEWALKHAEVAAKMADLQLEKQAYENRLKAAMGGLQVLDFGRNGKVHWTQGGDRRNFRNKVK